MGKLRRWEEQPGDRVVLEWVARFRFVMAAQISLRFGVSERRARSRLGRLARCGLVLEHQEHRSAYKQYALSKRGFDELGHIRRRAPQWDTQIRHETAIADLVARLELARPDLAVLTERECRQREAQRLGFYSVTCQLRTGMQRRWPDIVIEGDGRRDAIEIELTAKTPERLRTILLGYLVGREYQRVHIRCGTPSLQQRLEQLATELGAGDRLDIELL